MKDAFMPIVLTVIVIIVAIYFVMNIYNPQKQTVNALAENGQQGQTSVIAMVDQDGKEVSGIVVKAIYEQYSDSDVDVDIFESNGTTAIDVKNVKNDDLYNKEVKRNAKDKSLEKVTFKKQ